MTFLDEKHEIKLDVSVYVSNLGAYNAGQLTGGWVKLPVANVDDIYKRDREKFGGALEYGDEYFITDYESPFKIGEFQSLKALNELVKALKDAKINTLEQLYWYDVYNCDLDELEMFCKRVYDWNTDYDFNEQLEGYTPIQVMDALGDINTTDNYLYWDDGDGTINSMDELDFEKMIKKSATDLICLFAEDQGIKGIEK